MLASSLAFSIYSQGQTKPIKRRQVHLNRLDRTAQLPQLCVGHIVWDIGTSAEFPAKAQYPSQYDLVLKTKHI
jgi:hypothetical protein